MTSKYIAGTWALANLLHPFAMFFYFNGNDFSLSAADIGGLLPVLFYSFVFSLPSLLLGFLAGHFISLIPSGLIAQYIVWLFTAPLIVILNFILLVLVLAGGQLLFFELEIAIPGIISVFIASVIRYYSFAKAFNYIKHKKDETTTLV